MRMIVSTTPLILPNETAEPDKVAEGLAKSPLALRLERASVRPSPISLARVISTASRPRLADFLGAGGWNLRDLGSKYIPRTGFLQPGYVVGKTVRGCRAKVVVHRNWTSFTSDSLKLSSGAVRPFLLRSLARIDRYQDTCSRCNCPQHEARRIGAARGSEASYGANASHCWRRAGSGIAGSCASRPRTWCNSSGQWSPQCPLRHWSDCWRRKQLVTAISDMKDIENRLLADLTLDNQIELPRRYRPSRTSACSAASELAPRAAQEAAVRFRMCA